MERKGRKVKEERKEGKEREMKKGRKEMKTSLR